MHILLILGSVALAVVYMQIYYIILHYNDIVKFITKYSKYRYNIDIIPSYVDSSIVDYNDTIFTNVKDKRRCVLEIGKYTIVSSNGYVVNAQGNKLQFDTLFACIDEMTNNYNLYSLFNPCTINALSTACINMNSLL